MQARPLSDKDVRLRAGGLVARLVLSGAAIAGVTVLTRLVG